MISEIVVSFYRFWHGRLKLKGAGFLLGMLSPHLMGLHHYELKLSEGQKIKVDFRDVSAMYWLNYLLGDSFEEEGLELAVLKVANKNSVVWDIGANCGLFSYKLARGIPELNIHFFEPNPSIYRIAESALRPFTGILGHGVALSDHSGQAELTVPAGESTTGTLGSDKISRIEPKQVIECRVADELVEQREIPAPTIIKIDTEGHEVAVLLGMSRTLKKYRPFVFFEHISLSDEDIIQAIPLGYELFSVSDLDGSLKRGLDREHGHNSLLKPQEK